MSESLRNINLQGNRKGVDTSPHHYRRIAREVNTMLAGSLSRLVLDVGGSRTSRLAQGVFADFTRLTMNIPTRNHQVADILYNGRDFPIGDEVVDVAMAIDILEHVPEGERRAFLANLVRISKRGVILTCPFDSPQNRESEQEYLASLEKAGYPHASLQEHREMGLPSLTALSELASEFGFEMVPLTHTQIAFDGLQELLVLQLQNVGEGYTDAVAAREARLEATPVGWNTAYRALLVLHKPQKRAVSV